MVTIIEDIQIMGSYTVNVNYVTLFYNNYLTMKV